MTQIEAQRIIRRIVDDEPDHLSLMRNLPSPPYSVTTAPTAQQALDVCRQWVFHLGLVYVRLPDLPGPELVRRLRILNRQMGFVLVTAR